jgi:hypothetical protein
METLIINIPDKKSALVKQILKGLGVTIQDKNRTKESAYRKKLLKVSTWMDEDLKGFEDSRKSFENLRPQQW